MYFAKYILKCRLDFCTFVFMFNYFITVGLKKLAKKVRAVLVQDFIMINTKLDAIMNKQERFDKILTDLNEVTNGIAADYEALLKEVKDGTVSDESLAKAEANVATLKQIAASNDQPVPGVEVPPVTEGSEGNEGAEGNQPS